RAVPSRAPTIQENSNLLKSFRGQLKDRYHRSVLSRDEAFRLLVCDNSQFRVTLMCAGCESRQVEQEASACGHVRCNARRLKPESVWVRTDPSQFLEQKALPSYALRQVAAKRPGQLKMVCNRSITFDKDGRYVVAVGRPLRASQPRS